MNYYEELGVEPTASEVEIRKAFRNLSRIIHPDQHRDERLKHLAEVQMKRLSGIVDILCHEETRLAYNLSLQAATPTTVASPEPAREPQLAPLLAGIAFGCLLMFAACTLQEPNAVSALFDPMGSERRESNELADAKRDQSRTSRSKLSRNLSFPVEDASNHTKRKSVVETAAAHPAPGSIWSALSAAEIPPSSVRGMTNTSETALDVGRSSNPEVSNPEASNSEVSNFTASDPSLSFNPAERVPNQRATSLKSPPPSSGNRVVGIGGTWLYAPNVKGTSPNGKRPEKWDYTAEFVELRVYEEQGLIEGSYRSRYRIPDKPLQPEVSFRFRGAADGKEIDWEGPGGAKGKIQFEIRDENTLLARWRATETGKVLSLASGSALLIRRMD